MPHAGARALCSLIFAVGAVGVAACAPAPGPDPEPDTGPREPCVLGAPAGAVVASGPVTLFVEAAPSPEEEGQLELLRAEVQGYLARMSGADVAVVEGAPTGEGVAVHLHQSAESGAPQSGYRLQVTSTSATVTARSAHDLAYGAFALLERLGARFFHPLDELVPERTGGEAGALALPEGIDEVHASPFAFRGLHLHLLHPTEYLAPFLEPSAENLAVAKRTIDWLVKTGQNYVQWYLMRTVDWGAWQPHGQAIIEYAHRRGIDVGIVVQFLDDGSSLQNQWVLATSTEDLEAQIAPNIDQLMTLDIDAVEISLGEFFAGDPDVLLAALNYITAYLNDTYPGAELSISNHIGNYPELYLDWNGQEDFYYYHLPGEADPRLVSHVHTVFFFDLYRPWAMYAHEDFSLQREYIYRELPERKVRYYPESAYWVTADVDVPVFLAEFLRGRWTDIHRLVEDIAERGLPPLDGHLLFSSGHEWNYWLIDYLTARMLWSPETSLEDHLLHYSAAFGACAPEVQAAIVDYTDWNTRWLFDARLVPYASGEDIHDDLGYAANIDTHPPRVPFGTVRAMSADERRAFGDGTVADIEEAAEELASLVVTIADRCREAEGELVKWCAELVDGMEVTEARMRHSALLYRALLAALSGGDYDGVFAEAVAETERAAAIIERRAPHYRFDLGALTDAYENVTRYKFGYLRQAHTLCLWKRQEDELSLLVELGEPPSVFELRTCQD